MKKLFSVLMVISVLIISLPLTAQITTYACRPDKSAGSGHSEGSCCYRAPESSLPTCTSKDEELAEAEHPPSSSGSNTTINIIGSNNTVNIIENSDGSQSITTQSPDTPPDSTEDASAEDDEGDSEGGIFEGLLSLFKTIFDFFRELFNKISISLILERTTVKEMLFNILNFNVKFKFEK